jgi:hypothetical protein
MTPENLISPFHPVFLIESGDGRMTDVIKHTTLRTPPPVQISQHFTKYTCRGQGYEIFMYTYSCLARLARLSLT